MTAIEYLARSRAGIVIITSAKNRGHRLLDSYRKMASQTYPDWQWLILDNGSTDETREIVAQLDDPRVIYAQFTEAGGCAYPVRNVAIDCVVESARLRSARRPWLINVDSDDQLYDEFSLAGFRAMIRWAESRKAVPLFCHGVAAWHTAGVSGEELITSPSDTYRGYPSVPHVYDLFDIGLTTLSGAYSPEVLYWLRYPPEFSFEDNGFNAN